MVEFALIAVALFTIIFGIIEGALAVRAKNTIQNAAEDAARRGAVAGTAPNADYLILQQLIGRGAMNAAEVKYVVVFGAANSSATVDPDCLAGVPQTGKCNVFYPPFDQSEDQYSCASLGTSWCTSDRVTGGQLGFLGVHVESHYNPILSTVFNDFFDVDLPATSLQAIETSGEL